MELFQSKKTRMEEEISFNCHESETNPGKVHLDSNKKLHFGTNEISEVPEITPCILDHKEKTI